MRKLLFFIACLGLTAPSGAAAQSNDIEEIGNLAGAVMACGAYKPLYQFEEILSRYFFTGYHKPAECCIFQNGGKPAT